MKHLRQRVLPRLERELDTIVDGLEMPGIVARTFSKTARTASRKIQHISLER